MKNSKYPKVISFTGVLLVNLRWSTKILQLSSIQSRMHSKSLQTIVEGRLWKHYPVFASQVACGRQSHQLWPKALTSHWGESIPTLRSPWPCYLKLEAVALTWRNVTSEDSKHTHSHAQTHTFRLYTHNFSRLPNREIHSTVREVEKEIGERGLLQLGSCPPLMFEGNGMTTCYQCEGIWLSGFKGAMIYRLFDQWHSHSNTLSPAH